MENRIEVCEAENGYVVKVYKKEEEKSDEYGYVEPDMYVAETKQDALKLVAEHL